MSAGTSPKTVDVLIGSPRQEFWETIQVILKGYYPYKMRWVKSVEEVLESASEDFNPILALIDGQDGTSAASEWSQSTNMTFGNCKILVLHSSSTSGINFEQVKKNGASEIMHMGFDREFISDMVLQLAPIDIEGDHIPITALMPVDIRDLEIDSEINFDVYVHLPANQKTVMFRKAGTQLEGKSIDKFSNMKQNMYIKKTQMKAFFEYARTVLSARNVAIPVSMTEKFQKSKKSIFNIMSNFMNNSTGDFEEGRRILGECQSIIESFDFTTDRTPEDLYAELCRFTGNTRSVYHDAISIAAFAAFFSQITGGDQTARANAALAGLLHNIGIAQVPISAMDKKMATMTESELTEYKAYPERSVNMVKAKKVSLPPEVANAIGQHQELGNGTGFPKALKNDDIEPLSKILVIAYQFHLMTALENRQVSNTPGAAIKAMKDDAISGSGRFDLVLASEIAKKFSKFLG